MRNVNVWRKQKAIKQQIADTNGRTAAKLQRL